MKINHKRVRRLLGINGLTGRLRARTIRTTISGLVGWSVTPRLSTCAPSSCSTLSPWPSPPGAARSRPGLTREPADDSNVKGMAMPIVENRTIIATGGVDTHLEFHVGAV